MKKKKLYEYEITVRLIERYTVTASSRKEAEEIMHDPIEVIQTSIRIKRLTK